MQVTRQQILDFLRARGEGSIRDLGDHLKLTPTGVRQHLTILEREGFVLSREVRGRVGRPALVYSLTEAGEDSYQKRYDRLSNALLDALSTAETAQNGESFAKRVARPLADPWRAELALLPPEQRVRATCDILGEQDVLADWERDPDHGGSGEVFLLHERTCPYPEVARHNAAICEIDEAFMSSLTGLSVTLIGCQLDGAGHCTYRLSTEPATEPSTEPAAAAG